MLLCAAGVGRAQGSVGGQVTILERAGETTEDLGDVVVFLESPTGARRNLVPVNTGINLQSRQFSPRVRVVTQGSRIDFTNQDPFNHNVFSKAPGGAFDTGVYGRGKTRDNTFREAGVFPIFCDVHPRMTGYVIVMNTPFYTQPGTDGRFALDRVPAGRYVLHVWHDRATEMTRTIDVPAAGIGSLSVQLDARGWRYVQHKNKYGKDYASASGDRY
ncbi:MAG: hypothetical protein JWO05_124 [Gemmatimonadetes bacterium]|nr:hypothetical protein [Gemmatimonadota bacterium]